MCKVWRLKEDIRFTNDNVELAVTFLRPTMNNASIVRRNASKLSWDLPKNSKHFEDLKLMIGKNLKQCLNFF